MEEMSNAEIQDAIETVRVGILALASENRSYAFPVFFAYEDGTFYWHSHPGEKDRYVHDTDEACLTLVRGSDRHNWVSVMAFGEPEPLWATSDVEQAEAALGEVPPPPEMGTTPEGEPKRSSKHAVYWRMTPQRMTGRKSHLEPADGA